MSKPAMQPHQQAAVDACRGELQKSAGALSPATIEAIIQAILTMIQAFVPTPAPPSGQAPKQHNP
jgi:hypothetical protein